jgi:hypothetical protein
MRIWNLPPLIHRSVAALADNRRDINNNDTAKLTGTVRAAHKHTEANGDCLWWDVMPHPRNTNISLDYTFSKQKSEGLRAILNI